MPEDRWRLEKRLEIDASPGEVWEMVATAEGMSAWFVPHHAVSDNHWTADFGGGHTQDGRILAREEGYRVVYGPRDVESLEDSPFALEFLVEGGNGSGAVLHLVQSQVSSGSDWRREYDGFSKGWDVYLHNLASYLTYFDGLPTMNVMATTSTRLSAQAMVAHACEALGLDAELAVGDEVRIAAPGSHPLDGVVDLLEPGALLGLRTTEGLYRFMAHAPLSRMMATHYLYGYGFDRSERAQAWQTWLSDVFAATR